MLEWDIKLNSMVKLEQLSELLVSEISQFEKTVEKLERIQQQKIGIDSEVFEKVLLQHREKMGKENAYFETKMEKLGAKLERAKAYPIWALVVFTISLMANGILIYVIFF